MGIFVDLGFGYILKWRQCPYEIKDIVLIVHKSDGSEHERDRDSNMYMTSFMNDPLQQKTEATHYSEAASGIFWPMHS